MSTSNKMCAKLRRDAKTSDERRRFPWAPDSEYSQGRTSILSTERGTTSVSTSVDVGWNMGHVRGVAGPREGTREASVATKRCTWDEGGGGGCGWNVRDTMPSLRGGGYSSLQDADSNRFTRLFQPLLLHTATCAESSRIDTCVIHSVVASSLPRRKHSFTTSMCSKCLGTNGNRFPFHSRIQPNEEGKACTFPFARHRNGWNLALLSLLTICLHRRDPSTMRIQGTLARTAA